MPDSVLDSVKKSLGLAPTYDAFDPEIIMYINATFSTLNQLGVGPTNGFEIDGAEDLWEDFIGPNGLKINSVKTYMALKVRLIFDPPATSFAIAAMEKVIQEFEWRLNVAAEAQSSALQNQQGNLWNLTGKTDFPEGASIGDIGVDLNSGDIWSNNG